MKYLLVLFLLVLDLNSITLGVVPQQSPLKLMKVWIPIVNYLQKTTGEKVDLKLQRSISSFEKKLYNGAYDIAYMNPYHYIVAHKKYGYMATVRAKKDIIGILVANKKSGIKDISMTKGKTFLFPSPNAFAATLLTKYELLSDYGINIDEKEHFLYVNSHDSVYKGVARGIGDIGGGIERTFDNFRDKKTKDSLFILYRTKPYPSHPIAYKPSLSSALKIKFTKAFLNMPKNLLDLLSIKKIITTQDKEYNIVRNLAKKLRLGGK